MEIFQITKRSEFQSLARLGFVRDNFLQLFYHFVLASFIGISLRLTTFNEATAIAAVIGDEYKIKTSFLVSFGFTKAVSNLIVGRVSDSYGRKIPHSIGWIFGIILGIVLLVLLRKMSGDNAEDSQSCMLWYVVANICLGAQQGWTWTTNIFMFMDISGPRHRALSSGISNSMGYLSSAFAAYAAAAMSTEMAFRVVLGTCAIGWVMSTFLVRDTSVFVEQEMNEASYAPSNTVDSQSASGVLDEWDDEDSSANIAVANQLDHQPFTIPEAMEKLGPGDSNGSFCTVWSNTCWKNKSTAILCLAGLSTNIVYFLVNY
jgi:MFS family permease